MLSLGNAPVTPFFPDAPCGPRFSLRHRKTGALFCPQSQGQITFETGCIRITFRAFGLKGCMRFFVLPLDGAWVADLSLENPGSMEEQVDVLSVLELEKGPFSAISIRHHGENALLCRRTGEGRSLPLLYHSLAGDVQGILRPEEGTQPSLSLTGCLSLPSGEKAHLQFITKTVLLEADLPDAEPLLPPVALSLCETAARMALRFTQLSPAALPLYIRMLGCLYFDHPASPIYPPAPAQSLKKYGLSGEKPLLTVHLQQPDRALIRHLLSAHAFFETAGLETDFFFLCHENSIDTLQSLLSRQKGICWALCNEQEAEKMASLSFLHLKSGTPLAAQLDALTRPLECPALRLLPAPGEEVPPLSLASSVAGFTEEMDLCIFAPPPAPCRHLMMGQRFATLTCETGILHSFAPEDFRLAPLSPEKSEEYLLVTDAGACSLTGGLVFHRPGATQYQSRPMNVQCRLTLFSHISLPLGLRQITLQSPSDITCTLRCVVRFGEKSGVVATRRDAPFVYAAFSHREGIAFAHMEDASLFTLPPCCAGAADAAAFHREGGSVAVFEMPLHLQPHHPLSLCLTVGRVPDEQAARPIIEALHQQGTSDALRQVALFWQEKLEKLLVFGGAPEWRPFLNRWLPYWAQCGGKAAIAAPSAPDGLLSLLCCLHTDAPYARQQLLLRAGKGDETLLLPFLGALHTEITGDASILQERLPLENAPSFLQQNLSLLHSVEPGPHGLPQTAHPLWHPGYFQAAESVALGFYLCMAYARFAPLCDKETGKELMAQRRMLLGRLEQAWTENGYLPGWDAQGLPLASTAQMSQMCAALSCLAGAPREHARQAMHHALSRPPSPGLSPLLIMALCNIGACEAAWQMAREALPVLPPEEKSCQTAPAALLYYVYITKLLGLEKKGDQVRLMPCPGGETEEFSLVLRHHDAAYHLTASQSILFPTLDGEKIKNGWVTLRNDFRTHEARFPHRKA